MVLETVLESRVKKLLLGGGIFLGVLGGIAGLSYNKTTLDEVVVAIPYQTITEYDDTQREGIKTVKQAGTDGQTTITYEVSSNIWGIETNRKVVKTHADKPATDQIVIVGTKKYYTCSNGTEYDTLAAKNECEKRISWEKTKERALADCRSDSSKTNCWFDEYPGTNVHWTKVVKNTTYTPAPGPSSGSRSGAVCKDGWISSATGRGACSHHGGVRYWF